MRASLKHSVLLVVALIVIALCAVLSLILVRFERVSHELPVVTGSARASLVDASSPALASLPSAEDTESPSLEGSALELAEVDDAEPELAPAFPPPRLSIRGAVVDPDGQYVPWCSVELRDASWDTIHASSGQQGSFEFARLAAGEYTLDASPSRPDEQPFLTDSSPVEVRAGEQDVVLQLRRAGAIRGQVLDPATGASVRYALRLLSEGERDDVGSVRACERSGEFHFVQLLPGRYHLVAWESEGQRIALESDIEVAGGHETEVELVLEPGTTVTFALSEAAASGAPDVVVRAWTGERSLGVDWVTHRRPLEVRAPLGELRYVVEEVRYPTWLAREKQRLDLVAGERPRIEITPPAPPR